MPRNPFRSQPGFPARSKRTGLLVLLLVAGLSLGSACRARHEAAPPIDHVILVTLDTVRADHLGCYGYPRPTSPFIDSLARRGVRFEHAISSSSHTAPAHTSIFTSQYPVRHRVLVNGSTLDPKIPTMASLLRAGGFRTAASIAVGFLQYVAAGFENVLYEPPEPEIHRSATEVSDSAIAWIRRRTPNERFFLWVHYYDAHSNLGHPARLPERYRERLDDHDRSAGSEVRAAWKKQGFGDGLPDHLSTIETYDAQLAYVDAELERLFDVVAQETAGERVLWIVTADHGEGLGNHGYLGHGKHLFQEQLHVPLIFYSSGSDWTPRTVSTLVRHVDLMPTVAGLAGRPLGEPSIVEGRSLVGMLGGGSPIPTAEFALSERRPPDKGRLRQGWAQGLVIAAQDARYKFILKTEGHDSFFDLVADPLELENLVGRGNPAEERLRGWLVRQYRAKLKQPLSDDPVEIRSESVEELKALGYL